LLLSAFLFFQQANTNVMSAMHGHWNSHGILFHHVVAAIDPGYSPSMLLQQLDDLFSIHLSKIYLRRYISSGCCVAVCFGLARPQKTPPPVSRRRRCGCLVARLLEVVLHLHVERAATRVSDAGFPCGTVAIIRVAQGEWRVGVERVAVNIGYAANFPPNASKAMSAVLKQIHNLLPALSGRERGQLLGELLQDADIAVDEDVEAAWEAEIERRLDEVESGKVKLIDGDEFLRELREFARNSA
jgi:putative addiction module component (TIGR02574 family)